MTRRSMNAGILASAAVAAGPVFAAEEAKTMPSAAASKGGMPLMQALTLRRSTREYAPRPLPPQVLSDLLWAAFGINRPSGDRTAPYWRHIMVIDVYAAMADGVWLYEPKQHALAAAFARRHPRANGPAGFRRHRAAQSDLCRAWRADAGRLAAGPPALCIRRYRLHRPERLSVLRVGRTGNGVPRCRRLREARPNACSSGRTNSSPLRKPLVIRGAEGA